ncbi:uncharacterized protein LOC111025018 [Momordica charantia]|uniref:Uncharacterized protein LOC111025018 n=1 Tax=Momordica charantia TaxID=3673 RepID=A0A6J1DW73_MOMCH|nr:uncharacterized protein LOC111025018 [Momordica charantia]
MSCGFGWNDDHKCIEAEKEVFDDWVKSHPNAKGLRNKPPHYDDLTVAFGKDRATGANLDCPVDMASSAAATIAEDAHFEAQDFYIPDPPMFNTTEDAIEEDLPNTPTSKPTIGTSSGGSKRKRSGYTSEMVDVVRTNMRMQTAHLEKMATWPDKKEEKKIARRKIVHDQLKQIPNLEANDYVRLVGILMTNVKKSISFLEVPIEFKKMFCMQLLGKSE